MGSARQSKTTLNSDDMGGRCTPNESQSETDSSGMTNQDIVTCPYSNGAGHMNANSGSRQSQMTLLRQELIKTCIENDTMQKSYQETICTLNEKNKQLTKSLNEQTQAINELQAELKDTQRQLIVHENYNNPSSHATIFAKKCKKYRRTVEALNEGATLQEAQNFKGRRGRRIGAMGTSPMYTPDPSKTKEFVADICGGCGRTDTTIHDIGVVPTTRIVAACRRAPPSRILPRITRLDSPIHL